MPPRNRADDSAMLLWLLLAVLLLGAAATAAAQQGPRRWGGDVRLARPYREGIPDRRAGFTFCRLLYTSAYTEQGGLGWSTDYPGSDHNFMVRLFQFTRTDVSRWEDGQPGHAVVRATDPDLFQCPFLFASDIGTATFSPLEVERLREYLLKGGFLWVDDFWGEYAWRNWQAQLRRILPDHVTVDVPLDHRIFRTFYVVRSVPQIPAVQHWRRSGGLTSERGAETAEPHLRAVFGPHDQLLVLMSHNTDIADGWEREGEETEFFHAFSPAAYGLGINVVLWAMSH